MATQCRETKFQSTLSVRRATKPIGFITLKCGISIHALREESDNETAIKSALNELFQSTLSVRRATQYVNLPLSSLEISIHALREESDKAAKKITDRNIKISIHALREESDANTG